MNNTKNNIVSPQYLASVADSDGSFTLMKRNKQSTTKGFFYRSIFQLSWAPSKEAEIVMNYLKKNYGGSFSICKRENLLCSKHKTTLKYSVESSGLLKLINDIEPYLVLKKDRANLIKQQILLRKNRPIGTRKTEEMWQEEDCIYIKMNKLNSKNKKL